MPTSLAPPAFHARNHSAIWFKATGDVRSAPVAATSAMQTAIRVSSLYSPGAYGPNPTPRIAGSPSGGGANS